MRGHSPDGALNKIELTYGEILYPSMEKLLSKISLSEEDIFIDLGSGLGKLVLQVFLCTRVKEACGIEIIPTLHKQALLAAERVERELPAFYCNDRRLYFLQGSFLELPLERASIVLIGSPCFSPTMLDTLAQIISNIPRIHTVLTLRPLPLLEGFIFKEAVRVETSWDTALCYLYHRIAV